MNMGLYVPGILKNAFHIAAWELVFVSISAVLIAILSSVSLGLLLGSIVVVLKGDLNSLAFMEFFPDSIRIVMEEFSPAEYMFTVSLVVGVSVIAKGILSVCNHAVSQNIVLKARQFCFGRISEQDLTCLNAHDRASLLTALMYEAQSFSSLAYKLALFIKVSLESLILLLFAVRQDAFLTGVAMAFCIIPLGVVAIGGRKTSEFVGGKQDLIRRINSTLDSFFNSFDEKDNTISNVKTRCSMKIFDQLRVRQLQIFATSELVSTIILSSAIIGIGLLVLQASELQYLSTIVVITLFGRIASQLQGVGQLWIKIKGHFKEASLFFANAGVLTSKPLHIISVHEDDRKIRLALDSSSGLRMKNKYYGEKETEASSSTALKFGSVAWIVGENGVGKSAFVRSLYLALHKKGSSTFQGADYVFLLPSEVSIFGEAKMSVEYRKALDLSGFVQTFRFTGAMQSELSRGQNFLLALSWVMYREARFILIDESLDGCGSSLRKQIITSLREYARKNDAIVVIVSHFYSPMDDELILYLDR